MFGEIVMEYGKNQPIFFNEIMDKTKLSRSRVNQLVKESIDVGQLVRFSEGIFYVPTKTFFGNSILDVRKVIDKKYIKDNNKIFGIYTGITLLNMFGITMQVPNVCEIVTNKETTRVREIDLNGQKVILRKSRFEITKSNYKIYMLLELFNQIGLNEEFDTRKIVAFIKENDISYAQIMKYINYFPAKVGKNFTRSGVYYATL